MKPFLSEMDTNLQQLMSTSNNAIIAKQPGKKGRNLVPNSRNAVAAKMEQLRASSQLSKQYTSNNVTLDFDTLQARPGVHSTLGHFQTAQADQPLELTHPLASNETSNFNTTGILNQTQSNGSLQNSQHITKHATQAHQPTHQSQLKKDLVK